MKKIKELQELGFYVLEGVCSANTHLIENEKELDQFFIFADAYLRNYVTIYDYCVTSVGWNILVQAKDEATIMRYYEKSQERKDKLPNLDSVWLILSNQVRLFRSRFTNWTNEDRGRTGNASKTTYKRYVFTSLQEGIEYIEKVRNQEINLEQSNERYQALVACYDEDGGIGERANEMSSKAAQEEGGKSRFISLKICDYIGSRLEGWIRKTCERHNLVYEGGGYVVSG